MGKRPTVSFKLILAFAILMIIVSVGSIVAMRLIMARIGNTGVTQSDPYSKHYAFIHNGTGEELWSNLYQAAAAKGETLAFDKCVGIRDIKKICTHREGPLFFGLGLISLTQLCYTARGNLIH